MFSRICRICVFFAETLQDSSLPDSKVLLCSNEFSMIFLRKKHEDRAYFG